MTRTELLDLRHPTLENGKLPVFSIFEHNVNEIVRAALEEDRANPDHDRGFDWDGFNNFCPEHTPEEIQRAWTLYLVNRHVDRIMNGD